MAEPQKAAKARAPPDLETARGEGRRSNEKEVGLLGWSGIAECGACGSGGKESWLEQHGRWPAKLPDVSGPRSGPDTWPLEARDTWPNEMPAFMVQDSSC
jgi:hypothetical protein